MGEFHPSYIGPRPDVLELVPRDARDVLDVGCSAGALGEGIKARNGARVTGIEADPLMAEEARRKIDRVIVGDVEALDLAAELGEVRFDCIVLADVLEHLRDPWRVLRDLVARLETGGSVVASLPNVRHHSTLRTLALRGYWPYRDRGIHDTTHMRFFALRNVRELFAQAGLHIETLRRNYRLIEAPHGINRLARFLSFPPFREFLAFQYRVRARRANPR
jgi:2-polyprenyl-3-methyl-5-hydroxy-6-metoxy-1,4-benzoquinol methylase